MNFRKLLVTVLAASVIGAAAIMPAGAIKTSTADGGSVKVYNHWGGTVRGTYGTAVLDYSGRKTSAMWNTGKGTITGYNCGMKSDKGYSTTARQGYLYGVKNGKFTYLNSSSYWGTNTTLGAYDIETINKGSLKYDTFFFSNTSFNNEVKQNYRMFVYF